MGSGSDEDRSTRLGGNCSVVVRGCTDGADAGTTASIALSMKFRAVRIVDDAPLTADCRIDVADPMARLYNVFEAVVLSSSSSSSESSSVCGSVSSPKNSFSWNLTCTPCVTFLASTSYNL